MPVIPKGITPFTIKAPLTSTDQGEPTDDILGDTKRVFNFIQDERHLTALQLYKVVKSRIETWDKAHKKKAAQKGRGLHKGGGFLGGGGRKKAATERTAGITSGAQDQAFSDAKAFLQARHAQIIKLEVSFRELALSEMALLLPVR